MPEIKLIDLGVVKVDFGIKGDPERIVKMVGQVPHWLGGDGLGPTRFPGIEEWQEGVQEVEFAVATPQQTFHDINAAANYLDAAGFAGRGFPELTAVSDDMVKRLWDKGVWYVVAPAARWLSSGAGLCVPCRDCSPSYRDLDAYSVDDCWDEDVGFLVSRK